VKRPLLETVTIKVEFRPSVRLWDAIKMRVMGGYYADRIVKAIIDKIVG
jgi:hypothetical protein